MRGTIRDSRRGTPLPGAVLAIVLAALPAVAQTTRSSAGARIRRRRCRDRRGRIRRSSRVPIWPGRPGTNPRRHPRRRLPRQCPCRCRLWISQANQFANQCRNHPFRRRRRRHDQPQGGQIRPGRNPTLWPLPGPNCRHRGQEVTFSRDRTWRGRNRTSSPPSDPHRRRPRQGGRILPRSAGTLPGPTSAPRVRS